jgi:hypothetical protein
MIRGNNGIGTVLYSKEEVTQGDPLAMVAYGIRLLLIIRQLTAEFLAVKQPWYADDARAGGSFDGIRAYFHWLQEIGPKPGYYPEPDKCILVVREHNHKTAKAAFLDLSFKVRTGNCYLGGFIGEDSALRD